MNTLEIKSGVDFCISNTALDTQSVLEDIEDLKTEISTLKSSLETTTNLVDTASYDAQYAVNTAELVRETIDEVIGCYIALHEAVSTFEVDGTTVINSTNDPYNSAFLDEDNLPDLG